MLHSASLVISLRDKTVITPWKVVIFIILVSVVSELAPIIPLVLSRADDIWRGLAKAFICSDVCLSLRRFRILVAAAFFLAQVPPICELDHNDCDVLPCNAIGLVCRRWVCLSKPGLTGSGYHRSRAHIRVVGCILVFSLLGDAQWRTGMSLPATREDAKI